MSSFIFHTSFLFWIVLDPLGNIPIFVSLLKRFNVKRQRKIIWREMIIALGFMLIFFFFGRGFFQVLRVQQCSLQITGGILLFMIGVKMLFARPSYESESKIVAEAQEPLIVPLAVPAVAGPGILATIVLYSGNVTYNQWAVFASILIAWIFTVPFILVAPYLKKLLRENGLVAVERLFGYLIILIALQMALAGFITALKQCAISS